MRFFRASCCILFFSTFALIAAGLNRPVSSQEKTEPQKKNAAALRLIPQPKSVEIRENAFFSLDAPLTLEVFEEQAEILVPQIQEELKRIGLSVQNVRSVKNGPPRIRLVADTAVSDTPLPLPKAEEILQSTPSPVDRGEAYALRIDEKGITAQGCGPAGLYNAAQTVRQLLRANVREGKLPCLSIRDWPSLQYRCFMDDFTRGPSPKRQQILRYMDVGSGFKHNMFTYYMESQFHYQKHPIIAPKDGAIDIDDLRAMVDYGKSRNLTILGNQQSFGHSHNTVKHPEYAEMGEAGYILSPAVPRVYEYLDDLYSEIFPVLPFEMFNVCCDETADLGTGPSRELAEQIGVDGVYLMHIQKLHELLKKRGKRMMMWGDIIVEHPERIKELPPDMLVLCWGYSALPDFDAYILPFKESGLQFFVCPGLSNWSRILPDFQTSTVNIRNFVRDGVKYGALGMINTCWEDDGESLHGYNSYGIAWGGECAWSGSQTDIADFNRRIGAVLFGEPGDHFGKAIELLNEAQTLGLCFNQRFWVNDFPPTRSPKAIRKDSRKFLELVQPAIKHLEQCQKRATVNAELLDSYLLGARKMERIALRMSEGLECAEAYQKAVESRDPAEKAELIRKALQLVSKNRLAHQKLGEEFARIWNSESRPYALDWTMNKYKHLDEWYAKLESDLQKAAESAGKNEEIPMPEDLGIGFPGDSVRKTKPDARQKAAIGDEFAFAKKWLLDNASFRIGMSLEAGDCDRIEQPIELDIPFSEEVRSQIEGGPVRGFWITENAALEVPAQIRFSDSAKSGRFASIVPRIPRNTTGVLCAYFGRTEPPATELRNMFVRDSDSSRNPDKTDEFLEIENDRIRLRIGSEGGHVYRLELKDRADWDMTFPGETDWFGFSDTGGSNRSKKFRLKKMTDGPAMIRVGCFDEDDDLYKTITLFAGTSWYEVVLTEATWYYWDFDRPENFAADSKTPGTALFSNGFSAPAPSSSVPTAAVQIRQNEVGWGAKYNDEFLLGLTVPGTTSQFVTGPGGGMGGVGIETGVPRNHFATFAGTPKEAPAATMNGLHQTLNGKNSPRITLFEIEKK